MKILIAEDDSVSRFILEASLKKWGYDFISCCDGNEAWRALEKDNTPPKLAIFDWEMPGLNGLELCRRIRQTHKLKSIYVLMLTMRDSKEDIVKGLDGGADDYIVKPFDGGELQARLNVGIRIVELQDNLTKRVLELEESLSRVKLLQGLLPICSYCKKVRNDKNYWEQVEGYISKHSEAQFSHGICPDCYEKFVKCEIE